MKKIMNSINDHLNFTTETIEEFEDGKIPPLTLRFGLIDLTDLKKLHLHYLDMDPSILVV